VSAARKREIAATPALWRRKEIENIGGAIATHFPRCFSSTGQLKPPPSSRRDSTAATLSPLLSATPPSCHRDLPHLLHDVTTIALAIRP
jgi:hypothetical protein